MKKSELIELLESLEERVKIAKFNAEYHPAIAYISVRNILYETNSLSKLTEVMLNNREALEDDIKIPPILGHGYKREQKRYACTADNCLFESNNKLAYWFHGITHLNHPIGERW